MRALLDSLTIVRFAHMFREPEAGGTEQYLDCLNRMLLKRNRMTIVQTYDSTNVDGEPIETERIGKGQLIWVPIGYERIPRWRTLAPADLRRAAQSVSQMLNRKSTISDAASDRAWTVWLGSFARYLRYSYAYRYNKLVSVLNSHRVNLMAFHWLGPDIYTLAKKTVMTNVPFITINHYDNAKYGTYTVRRLVADAAGLAGVSNRNIPRAFRHRYVNLSDAVDLEFFAPGQVEQPIPVDGAPIILLPGRVTPSKGHLDALRALTILTAKGKRLCLAFAGVEKSLCYCGMLRNFIEENSLKDRVRFLGPLSQPQLRAWYDASTIVILPSYSEGLGRILLEAQAMAKPVIAYDVGGTSDALLSGRSGFLVKRGDFVGLAMKIGSLLDEPMQREAMGECGRSFVREHFTLSRLVERHERFYIDALTAIPATKHRRKASRNMESVTII